jgi:hypothetical protein
VQEVAQGILRDPAVLAELFEPGVTTEIAPGVGNHERIGVGLTHRDAYSQGLLRDLTFGSQQWLENYRVERQEQAGFAWLNLAGNAPPGGTHILGQYLYSDREGPLPGSLSNPLLRSDTGFWNNEWNLSARSQVARNTFAWLHFGQQVAHVNDENPDTDTVTYLIRRSQVRFSGLVLDGRLDHRWGGSSSRHLSSLILFGGQEDFDSQDNSYDPISLQFQDIAFSGENRLLALTLQDNWQLPRSRTSLIAGLTAESFREEHRSGRVGGTQRTVRDTDATTLLPYGEATTQLGERDLLRLIIQKHREHLLTPLLRPSEVFVTTEPPTLAVGGSSMNYELDYEHRFNPYSFAKLFLFLNDVDDFFVTPFVRQTPELLGFTVPDVRAAGAGVRYEQQLGRFVSGYLRATYREATDRGEGPTHGWQLPLNPRWRSLLGLSYLDRAGNKLFIEADWRSAIFTDPIWFGDVAFDPTAPRPQFPSKLLVNLRLGQEPSVFGEWVLRVDNLFNTKTIYWNDFPAVGRTYGVEYRWRF